MEKYLGIFLIAILTLFLSQFFQPHTVFGEEKDITVTDAIQLNQTIITESNFTSKIIKETEIIPKKTIYEDDPEKDVEEEKEIQEGSDGKIIKTIKVIMHEDKEYERELVSKEILPAIDKKIVRGTKIVWKTIQSPDGEIRYWKKMRVWATHYDQYCKGCDAWTAIGMRAGKGVIAVDPKVIKMRSKVYIPGYGVAIAGDTGGAIKGNIIDLGFEDARTANWSARFVDIYLM